MKHTIPKTEAEIEIMHTGGKKLAHVRDSLFAAVAVGVTPMEIETLAQRLIAEAGGTPSFMTVKDYQWATCISVNEGVVHGIPTTVPFKAGDVVSIDVGLLYERYHTDTSWSTYLPDSADLERNDQAQAFLRAGEDALTHAIAQARVGNRIGDISHTIQQSVEGEGYFIVPQLVGHGIGKILHEAPQVPGVLHGQIEKTPLITAGTILAIEVIYGFGTGEVVYPNQDGWTLATEDGSIAGLFEHTVLVSENGPVILTKS